MCEVQLPHPIPRVTNNIRRLFSRLATEPRVADTATRCCGGRRTTSSNADAPGLAPRETTVIPHPRTWVLL
eukprot:gene17120-biopygen17316